MTMLGVEIDLRCPNDRRDFEGGDVSRLNVTIIVFTKFRRISLGVIINRVRAAACYRDGLISGWKSDQFLDKNFCIGWDTVGFPVILPADE
jgi:hypothetical protein